MNAPKLQKDNDMTNMNTLLETVHLAQETKYYANICVHVKGVKLNDNQILHSTDTYSTPNEANNAACNWIDEFRAEERKLA